MRSVTASDVPPGEDTLSVEAEGRLVARTRDPDRHHGPAATPEKRIDGSEEERLEPGGGLRQLRVHLELAGKGPVRLHMLLSHTHADHIQGLPFFLPALAPGSQITV